MNKVLFNILNSYFNLLSRTGYIKYSEVLAIISFLFLHEILAGDLSSYITEEDHNIIMNHIEELSCSSCLIQSNLECNNINIEKSKLYTDYIKESTNIINIIRDLEDKVDKLLDVGNHEYFLTST